MFKPLRGYHFKYTLSQERIQWCKGVYNTIGKIVERVGKIPYNTYQYEGPCNIGWWYDDNKVSNNLLDKPTGNVNIAKQQTLTIKSKNNTANYCITGGTAYEILNAKYPQANLRKYVDPTGDIDIVVQSPLVSIVDDIEDTEYEPFVTLFNQDGTTLNNYYRAYMHWIYDKFIEILENINLTTGFEPFDINTEYPARHIPQEHKSDEKGYKYTQVGNCYVVCFLDRIDSNMIKIQLVGKIGMTVDHMVEFIIVIPNEEYNLVASSNQTRNKLSFMNVNSINIQPYNELINDNVSAYLTRYIYPQQLEKYIRNKEIITNKMEKEFLHKSTNHVGRLIYLMELSKYLPLNEKKTILSSLNNTFATTNKDLFNTVFPGNYRDVYNNAYFYFYELKNGKYIINKIKIVDLLAEYSSVFASEFIQSPIKFMGIVVNASAHKSTQKLITKNEIMSKFKHHYFTRKTSNRSPSSTRSLSSNRSNKRITNNYST